MSINRFFPLRVNSDLIWKEVYELPNLYFGNVHKGRPTILGNYWHTYPWPILEHPILILKGTYPSSTPQKLHMDLFFLCLKYWFFYKESNWLQNNWLISNFLIIRTILVTKYPQLLENSQLTLMEEWRGWCATFTWAIIAHPTSPVIRTAHKS